MTRRAAALLCLLLCSCAAFTQDGPTVARTVADALAPLLPALVSNYRANGAACVAIATTRAEADGCLVELRSAFAIWDALEPIRGTLDKLAAVETEWRAAADSKFPPKEIPSCAVTSAPSSPQSPSAPSPPPPSRTK